MHSQTSQHQQFIPTPEQAGRIIFQLSQAINDATRHSVIQDGEGIHVHLDQAADLWRVPNKMAEPFCTKITVQDLANSPGQIVTYDQKGVVQFRFGDPLTIVRVLFTQLEQKRLNF